MVHAKKICKSPPSFKMQEIKLIPTAIQLSESLSNQSDEICTQVSIEL